MSRLLLQERSHREGGRKELRVFPSGFNKISEAAALRVDLRGAEGPTQRQQAGGYGLLRQEKRVAWPGLQRVALAIEFARGLRWGGGKRGVSLLMTEGSGPERVEGWGCPYLKARRRAGWGRERARSLGLQVFSAG